MSQAVKPDDKDEPLFVPFQPYESLKRIDGEKIAQGDQFWLTLHGSEGARVHIALDVLAAAAGCLLPYLVEREEQRDGYASMLVEV